MFLFIFESIGTSELILIGIVALIFLGPRKLPEMARKAGKIMSEFRGTASEFKETWRREVNFEEEAKLLNIKDLDAEPSQAPAAPEPTQIGALAAPAIKEIDPSEFNNLGHADNLTSEDPTTDPPGADDKQNWL